MEIKTERKMKNIYFSILCSIVLSLTGCQTPEELVMDESSAGAHGFNVKFSDGSGDFYPEKAAPYNDGEQRDRKSVV